LMPLLAASAGGNCERLGAVRGEVVVSDVVFPVNDARGELTTPSDGGGTKEGEAEGMVEGAIEVAEALGHRDHARVALVYRPAPETSQSAAKVVPRDDDLDR
jgi:hypothetical protein